MSTYKAASFNRQMETDLRVSHNLIVVIVMKITLLRTKDKIITKKFDHVKSGVTIYLFSPLSIFLQTLLWWDFSPLVGNDCDKNDGYTIVDRYIRHGDSREGLEVPEYIADTCSHDGASLPGKTRFDQTCNSLSFLSLSCSWKRGREGERRAS